MRILSLVPSITETLFDFGISEQEVVGRTKFCIHPKNKVLHVPIIGGTKNLNLDKIKNLNPSLIIANREENEKLQVDALSKDFNVWVTEIATLEDNRKFVFELGELLGKKEMAIEINNKINTNFAELPSILPLKTAYLIWKNPYMSIGGDTFITAVLEKVGLENIFSDKKRYPIIEVSDLQSAELILLSSEPFPFKNADLEFLKNEFPNKKLLIVDGETFSWHGSHLMHCGSYLKDFCGKISS